MIARYPARTTMAKTKSKASADPKKRLKKILTSLRGDSDRRPPEAALVAEIAELLGADAGLAAEVDALRIFPHAASLGLCDLCDALLTHGADPQVQIEDDGPTPLATLFAADGDDARVIALAEKMLARGVDLNARGDDRSALDSAVDSSLARVEAVLRLGADDHAVIAALHVALPNAARSRDRSDAIAQRLLTHLSSVDAPGHDGLSALHIVALRGTPALLAATLARSAAPGHAVTLASHFLCDGCSPPGGGIIPNVLLAPGFTARDLVTEVHAMYAAASVWYGEDGFDGKRRLLVRDELAAKLDLLAAVPHGTPDRADLPAFAAEVDALLARLAAHVSADEAALARRAAAIPIGGVGPWTYASTLLERAGSLLLRGAIEAHRSDNWLAHIIAGDHRRFLAARQKTHGHDDPDLSQYPTAAHRPVKKGLLVGGRGDTLLYVWPHAEGVARLGAVRPGEFVELGDDFFDFLRRQLAELGVAIDDVPTSGATGPRGRGSFQILKADYARKPGPRDIDRVGGLPIGVDAATWPRRGGAPMHHVLTIDLEHHPTFQPRGVRALALFVSSPMEHEAFTPRNDHTRVLLLSDADLAKGEPAWPEGLSADDTLEAGTVQFESAAAMTQEELYRHSFAGLMPIWLQGDDTESVDEYGEDDEYSGDDDEYSDDDDSDSDSDSGDDDERPAAPVHFILQFDESLIPGINLGDCGIMYVYAETAWFQCH